MWKAAELYYYLYGHFGFFHKDETRMLHLAALLWGSVGRPPGSLEAFIPLERLAQDEGDLVIRDMLPGLVLVHNGVIKELYQP